MKIVEMMDENSVKHVFCDLDGVLCDFERGVKDLTGYTPEQFRNKAQVKDPNKGDVQLNNGQMWKQLSRAPGNGFYAELEWMPDGKALWSAIKHLNPTILTGIPMGNWAADQKRLWCSKNLGANVPVITCFAREKQDKARDWIREDDLSSALLIDDTAKNIDNWKTYNGIALLHTSTGKTLAELRNLMGENF
jgi:hypothetical protein